MTVMPPGSEGPGAGRLLTSLQGLSATLVAILQTRLALLATEVEEEKHRMMGVLGWGAVAVMMGTVACVFLAGFVTVLFWERHPLMVLGVLTCVFAAICLFAVRRIGALTQPKGGMLAASLAELQADHEALAKAAARGRGDAASPPQA
jgi:uncharacterized membrane protein YqjE